MVTALAKAVLSIQQGSRSQAFCIPVCISIADLVLCISFGHLAQSMDDGLLR